MPYPRMVNLGTWHPESAKRRTRVTEPAGSTTPGTGLPVAGQIRDSLYDLIPVSEPELALLGSPAFLRLERIQQLGFVSRIWPGARHARYEHSLGVLYLARLALDHLRRHDAYPFLKATDDLLVTGPTRTNVNDLMFVFVES